MPTRSQGSNSQWHTQNRDWKTFLGTKEMLLANSLLSCVRVYFYKSIKYENIKTKTVISMKTKLNPLKGLDEELEKSRMTLNLESFPMPTFLFTRKKPILEINNNAFRVWFLEKDQETPTPRRDIDPNKMQIKVNVLS